MSPNCTTLKKTQIFSTTNKCPRFYLPRYTPPLVKSNAKMFSFSVLNCLIPVDNNMSCLLLAGWAQSTLKHVPKNTIWNWSIRPLVPIRPIRTKTTINVVHKSSISLAFVLDAKLKRTKFERVGRRQKFQIMFEQKCFLCPLEFYLSLSLSLLST